MDPRPLLKKQHREVKALLKKLEKARGAAERRELLGRIITDLQLHMKIEEEMFYPALKELPTKKASETMLEAFEEHGVAKLVMAELPKVDPSDERFEAKVTVFHQLIEHHVEEEEGQVFKLADKLDEDDLDDLGERMKAEVDRAMARQRQAA